MGGSVGVPPVAITAVANLSVLPLTSMVSLLVNFPRPWNTSTPSSEYREAESTGEIFARRRRMRSITLPKSTVTSPVFTPNSLAFLASCAARAARMRALLGTQPTLRQSPPIRCSSMMATFPPRPAAMEEDTSPPAPAPITTILYLGCGSGSSHLAGCTLSRSLTLCSSSGLTSTSAGAANSSASAPSYAGSPAWRLSSLLSAPLSSLLAHWLQLTFSPVSSVSCPP
mmetsp:Transcript_18887/g.48478  ORF Transcript_18887/g.48478 Transcript_18887/m.48478 type:complete len:227 (+) Transcript_18887:616-1296(+)